jgi:acetyl esterase/lipase
MPKIRLSWSASVLFASLILFSSNLLAQENKTPPPPVILLWPSGAPLAQGTAPEDQPRITVYLPKGRKTQTAVVVCPGGGYGMLAVDHEGKQIAQWLNNLGIAAFVLEYRLGPKYHHPAQLLDALRALRYVRSRAEEYHMDSHRIGIWGFSAGGHLAAMAGTMFDAGDSAAKDSIDRVSSRPDFLILDYALTDRLGSASDYSYGNLLGKDPDPKRVAEVTPVLHVTHETPPTFLVHSDDDEVVLPQNSINFYLALKKAGVPAELHIYRYGGHGYGLAPLDPVLSSYALRLADWLRGIGVL